MIRLIIFFMAAMMAAGGTSMAEDISKCPVDTIPIQIVYGLGSRPVTTLSVAGLPLGNQSFSTFITSVTEHLAARLAQEKLCLSSAESQERSLIQFVELYLDHSEKELNNISATVQSLEDRSSGGCRISSPWIDLVIEREPVPSVRAIVRYSERQLLADQAVLAGARDVPLGVALPLKGDEFRRCAYEYEGSELFPVFDPKKPLPKPIEERVPADLLWLFKRATQSTRGPFVGYVGGAMNNAMEKGSEGYTRIVIGLIDRCFEAEGADIQYNNILDIADPVLLEKYKIVTPLY